MNTITIDKNAKQITFINNGIGFSQFGVAKEILDLIENQQEEIERLNNNWNKLEKYLNDKVAMYGKFGDLSRMAECQIISQKLWEIKGDDKNESVEKE